MNETETPSSSPIPESPAASWSDLPLSRESLELIEKAGYKAPTEVQMKAIPPGLEGKDLVVSAQTGTGKTAAFILPLVERILGRKGTLALILAPTREIAQQIQETFKIFGESRGLKSCVLIGGTSMRTDGEVLQTYPQVIIATPGRLCDHMERGNVWLDYVEVVVLDEADRMLDMGFAIQLGQIMDGLPDTKQTLLFSATIPPEVDKLTKKTLKSPVRIMIGKPTAASHLVDQVLLWMNEESKNRELRRLIREESGPIIVFTRSKDQASRIYFSLHSAGFYDATVIHSDRMQKDREEALAGFKSGKYRILMATDVAARGLHVDSVALVINYDVPLEAEDYVHRIGRTGRAGASGRAITFASYRDRDLVRRIENLIKKPIPAEYIDPMHQPQRPSSGGANRNSRPPRRRR